jgi:protein phosphatase
VQHVTDLKLAPFHILATEGAVHVDKDHEWHMEMIAGFCGADMGEGVLMTTSYRVVDVTDADSQTVGAAWWEELTERGGEGMVVKPLSFIARGRGLLQPAVKCRGREYLRIIYGPEYSLPENLDRLRSRGLGHKRSLALREFALGVEALERFVRREPLRRVHECVFGVLALESEPVDPWARGLSRRHKAVPPAHGRGATRSRPRDASEMARTRESPRRVKRPRRL